MCLRRVSVRRGRFFCCEEGGGDAQACLTRPLIKRHSYSNKPAIIRKKIEQIKRKQHILNHRIIQSGRIRYGICPRLFFPLRKPPGGITQTRATRYIYVGLAPPSGGQFWVPHPPLRLGILIFTAKRRKKEKKKRKTLCPPFFLKDHALPCMVWPALCPPILQPARAPVLPLVLVVECLVPRWPARFQPPIWTRPSRFRSYARIVHTALIRTDAQHNAQQEAGKPIGRGLPSPSPAHLGALTRPHRPHSSIAKGAR